MGHAPASRVMPLTSNVRPHIFQIQMPNTRSAFALRRWATAERAARPASLASSARAEVLVAGGSQASARAARPLASGALPVSGSAPRGSGVLAFRGIHLCSLFPFAASERLSAQGTGLRSQSVSSSQAAIFPFGASALAFARSNAHQATNASRVPLILRPNPSVEGTCPGKPGHAPHLKR